jgi:hypothetical protein
MARFCTTLRAAMITMSKTPGGSDAMVSFQKAYYYVFLAVIKPGRGVGIA